MTSDSEETTSEGNPELEELLHITGALADGTHLEELKWIKKCIDDELSNRKELDEEDFVATLVPNFKTAFDNPTIQRLLKFLRLEIGINQLWLWLIPICLDEVDLQFNSRTLQGLICNELNSCNVCKIDYKSILKHLKKSEKCMNNYSKEEFDELLQMARYNKKQNESWYRIKNKSSIALRKSNWYNKNKDKIVAKLEERKEETSMKVLAYQRKNGYQISKRKAQYYIDNKEKIKARYEERKIAKKEQTSEK